MPTATWSPLGDVRRPKATFYLNNWKGFDHRACYARDDAFFDLGTSGPEADRAARMRVGDTCIVATREFDGRVTFARYVFGREELLPRDGVVHRVLCGQPQGSATFSQADAVRQSAYAAFFDKSGHFKRQLVIPG